MPIQKMTKCGKMAWQTSQEWRPMVSVHSWGSKLLAVASKGWTAGMSVGVRYLRQLAILSSGRLGHGLAPACFSGRSLLAASRRQRGLGNLPYALCFARVVMG